MEWKGVKLSLWGAREGCSERAQGMAERVCAGSCLDAQSQKENGSKNLRLRSQDARLGQVVPAIRNNHTRL